MLRLVAAHLGAVGGRGELLVEPVHERVSQRECGEGPCRGGHDEHQAENADDEPGAQAVRTEGRQRRSGFHDPVPGALSSATCLNRPA